MFCIHCGKQIDDDALFCPECGMRTDVEHDGPEAAPEAKDQAAANLPRTDSAAGDAPQAPVHFLRHNYNRNLHEKVRLINPVALLFVF